MKNLHNCGVSLLITALSLSVLPLCAKAEGALDGGGGTGLFGANRRVETEISPFQDYCGVEGVFSVPTIFVPDGTFTGATDANNPYIVPGRANSKPTFYLGGRRSNNNFALVV